VPEGHDLPELSDDENKPRQPRLHARAEIAPWSGFSNFAISFSIISILAGCFTSFGLGWKQTAARQQSPGGWPIVSVFILIIGLCMSELVSAYPTSGGILLVGKQTRWGQGRLLQSNTGWLNLIGLIRDPWRRVAYGRRDVPGPHAGARSAKPGSLVTA